MPRYNPEPINRAMGEKRITAEQLSEMSGVGMTVISLIRNGKQNATDETLGRIADALGFPMSAYYAEDQEQEPKAA